MGHGGGLLLHRRDPLVAHRLVAHLPYGGEGDGRRGGEPLPLRLRAWWLSGEHRGRPPLRPRLPGAAWAGDRGLHRAALPRAIGAHAALGRAGAAPPLLRTRRPRLSGARSARPRLTRGGLPRCLEHGRRPRQVCGPDGKLFRRIPAGGAPARARLEGGAVAARRVRRAGWGPRLHALVDRGARLRADAAAARRAAATQAQGRLISCSCSLPHRERGRGVRQAWRLGQRAQLHTP
mmetsp:Transcript_17767/g.45467  ORF Transcript_17767/g.45467 Transcript_17767/m.45467 type:complete len:235 (-) Transcript_17767:46-750(-)